MSETLQRVLVVTAAFGEHAVGAVIRDAEEIARVLAGGHAHRVVVATHLAPDAESPAAPAGG